MTETIDKRACRLALYVIETGCTVRAAAKQFGISKSTVHKDLCQILPRSSPALFIQVRQLMEKNKSERHIRGGMATKQKYAQL